METNKVKEFFENFISPVQTEALTYLFHSEEKEAARETILAFFKAYYKTKGNTDMKFVQKRADIYMKIAEKRAEAKKDAKK